MSPMLQFNPSQGFYFLSCPQINKLINENSEKLDIGKKKKIISKDGSSGLGVNDRWLHHCNERTECDTSQTNLWGC